MASLSFHGTTASPVGVLRCRLVECYPCPWTTLLPMSPDYTRLTPNVRWSRQAPRSIRFLASIRYLDVRIARPSRRALAAELHALARYMASRFLECDIG